VREPSERSWGAAKGLIDMELGDGQVDLVLIDYLESDLLGVLHDSCHRRLGIPRCGVIQQGWEAVSTGVERTSRRHSCP
jgi:hypothetical protein